MDIVQQIEQEAVAYFASQGIDIATKEKRIALTPELKEQVLSFCMNKGLGYRVRGAL